MSKISIVDLEVFYRVGVPDEERAKPQRLLLTADMTFDFSIAAVSDRIGKTIDYHAVAQLLLGYGQHRSWKLIEKVAMNIADAIMAEILFIKTSSLGDVIHHMPAITEARRHLPDARFAWVVEEAFAPLVRLHPAVDETLPVASRRWRHALLQAATWRDIRSPFRAKQRA